MGMSRPLRRALPASLLLLALLPGQAAAHALGEQYQAPLPLIGYVVGAAIAVAMSFAFVILRNPSPPARKAEAVEPRRLPAWLRGGLRLLGLLAWLWIVAQAISGGSGDADVASLFLWVYGWVGLALVSAVLGPVWPWLDPFSTLHMILSGIARRLGLSGDGGGGGGGRPYPRLLSIWPAVIGFAFFIWLELVARVEGGRTLGVVLVGYTFITLAGMLYYGREAWRTRGEVFSVWFGLLGRLAPYELVGRPEDGLVRRRPFASGLGGRWSLAALVLITLGTASIIFDGLSQTQLYFDLFRRPGWLGLGPVIVDTIVAAAFMLIVLGLVLVVARRLGTSALSAGLLPVAVGYLVAHYLVFLLVDGQRIVNALNDPLQRGDNLLPFDLGFYEPALFVPTAIVWTIQLAAVVGGHLLGAWAGHSALTHGGLTVRPLSQLPLAALMVLLTSVTLWSLGQAVILEPEAVDLPTLALGR
jgi:hypothetical protein